jgi:hypothetical protein
MFCEIIYMQFLVHIYVSYAMLSNIFYILVEYPVASRRVTN